MQVANLPSDNSRASGHVTKRLLQGRPLPAILVDNHPGPRYPTFRPHQRRLSQQKGGSGAGREGASTPCDSGVSFSSMEGDPLSHLLPGPASGKSSQPIAITKMGRPKKKRHTPVAPPSTSTGTAPATVSGPGALGSSTAPSVGTGPGGGGGAGLMSSTSSGVSSGRTSEQLHRKAAAKASRMGQHDRATTMEGTDYFVNPEPVPFMPSNFMSSTMLKKIPIPKRHQDTFGGYEYNFTGQRGVMMHTDRYQVRKQYEVLKTLEGLNQRDRLLAEMAYLEDLRSIRRRREVVPHRVQLDLFLGGKKLDCEERFDIKREIQRLKAMAMPARARDLFHGKGIHLPPNHMSVLPRPSRGPDDTDSEEEVRISAPASMIRTVEHSFNQDMQSPTFERQISLTLGEVPHTRSVLRGRRHQQLPGISKNQTPRTEAAHDDTNLSSSQPSMPQTSRSAAWVEEQNQLLSHPVRPVPAEEMMTKRPQTAEPTSQTRDLAQTAKQDGGPPDSEGGISPGRREEQCRDEQLSSGVAEVGRQQVLIQEDEEAHDGHQTSPPVSHTPNPLKAVMELDVSVEQETNLRQTFQRLDTDMDGHLQYHQLKSQLPKEFSNQQECFVKQVYEITQSSAAFFGVDEFLMMTQLTKRVASLSGQAQEAYGKIDFDTLEGCIIKYVDLFQRADSGQKGRISAQALRELLGESQSKPAPDENSHVWNSILDSLSLDYTSHVNRIEYLAHIPLFMALAPPIPFPSTSQPEHSSLQQEL